MLYENAPAAISGKGQVLTAHSIGLPVQSGPCFGAADTDPSHPANLLTSLARHLLERAFGYGYCTASKANILAAQKLALCLLLRRVGNVSKLPVWVAVSAHSAAAVMLWAYARLDGAMPLSAGTPNMAHALALPSVQSATLDLLQTPAVGTLEHDELALRMHLDEFTRHARLHAYTEAKVVQLASANGIKPPFPFFEWAEVHERLGVME